ncbi:MAG: hypothetical protein K4H23_05085 [Mollicutes bacterium PWAP]|nr:hypothetical protein [Mollicutes bacterium PWAP]
MILENTIFLVTLISLITLTIFFVIFAAIFYFKFYRKNKIEKIKYEIDNFHVLERKINSTHKNLDVMKGIVSKEKSPNDQELINDLYMDFDDINKEFLSIEILKKSMHKNLITETYKQIVKLNIEFDFKLKEFIDKIDELLSKIKSFTMVDRTISARMSSMQEIWRNLIDNNAPEIFLKEKKFKIFTNKIKFIIQKQKIYDKDFWKAEVVKDNKKRFNSYSGYEQGIRSYLDIVDLGPNTFSLLVSYSHVHREIMNSNYSEDIKKRINFDQRIQTLKKDIKRLLNKFKDFDISVIEEVKIYCRSVIILKNNLEFEIKYENFFKNQKFQKSVIMNASIFLKHSEKSINKYKAIFVDGAQPTVELIKAKETLEYEMNRFNKIFLIFKKEISVSYSLKLIEIIQILSSISDSFKKVFELDKLIKKTIENDIVLKDKFEESQQILNFSDTIIKKYGLNEKNIFIDGFNEVNSLFKNFVKKNNDLSIVTKITIARLEEITNSINSFYIKVSKQAIYSELFDILYNSLNKYKSADEKIYNFIDKANNKYIFKNYKRALEIVFENIKKEKYDIEI